MYVPATAAVAYVTLSSLTASGWLAQSYSYAVGSPPVAAPLQLNATPTAMVPASGQEVLYSYGFSAGDARTITGVQVGGVPVSARIAGAAAGSVTVGLASTAGAGRGGAVGDHVAGFAGRDDYGADIDERGGYHDRQRESGGDDDRIAR